MHQKRPHLHPGVTARMKIDFISAFSALELFFLSTLAHWVKSKLFNSLCNLSLHQAKTNTSDLMLGHDLEYLRTYRRALRLKIVVVFFFLDPSMSNVTINPRLDLCVFFNIEIYLRRQFFLLLLLASIPSSKYGCKCIANSVIYKV